MLSGRLKTQTGEAPVKALRRKHKNIPMAMYLHLLRTNHRINALICSIQNAKMVSIILTNFLFISHTWSPLG